MNSGTPAIWAIILFLCFSGVRDCFCVTPANNVCDSLKIVLENTDSDSAKIRVYCELSKAFNRIDPDKALEYADRGLRIAEKISDRAGIAKCYNHMGIAYDIMGEYNMAIENYMASLKINEEMGNDREMAKTLNNIGIVFDLMENYPKAIEYYCKSLEIKIGLKDDKGVATTYLNIANVYLLTQQQDSAKKFIGLAKNMIDDIDDDKFNSAILSHIGTYYAQMGNFILAREYFEKALAVKRDLNDKQGIIVALRNIGGCYTETGYYKTAAGYVEEALSTAIEINAKYEIKDAYHELSRIYELMGNKKLAYEYYIIHTAYKDSLQDERNQKQIAELETKYETEQKEKEIELLNKNRKLQDLEIEETREQSRKQRIIIYSFVIGFLIIGFFSFLLLRQFRQRKKINRRLKLQNEEITQQKEEIESQRDEIESQRDEIEAQRDLATEQRDQIDGQKKEITSSIEYASKIQKVLLPSENVMEKVLPEHFVFYRPKDIVSGDFYWVAGKKDLAIAVAADCTGHGVPGAFMSMLGIAYLNEVVNKTAKPDAAEILNQLRNKIIQSLHQTDTYGETKDGMDISLCIINQKTRHLQYAGAQNPVYVINGDRFKEIKGDKMPIGIYYTKTGTPFTNHDITLEKGAVIYIFSDGFADQFGGADGKKFKYGNFKKLLAGMHRETMKEQRAILEKTFEKWRKHEAGREYEQIDDVLVMGIKI